MNHDRICSYLAEAGYDAELAPDGSTLTLGFDVGERRISLVHAFPSELLRVPKFQLAGGHAGKLAHVGVSRNGGPGEVCIADEGSTVVNTDRLEFVYLETVRKHVALLTRLIENPAYNRAEQLREFEAHWEILCWKEPKGLNELFVAWDGHGAEGLQVKPARADSGTDLRKTPIALAGKLANHQQLESVRRAAEWESRPAVGKGLVPHPVSWTHVYATRHGVARIARALRVACDTPASRGASTGCNVRRTRRRPHAPRQGFERPGRRRLAP